MSEVITIAASNFRPHQSQSISFWSKRKLIPRKKCEYKLKSENLSKIHQICGIFVSSFQFRIHWFSTQKENEGEVYIRLSLQICTAQKFRQSRLKSWIAEPTEIDQCTCTLHKKINREEAENKETKTIANKSRNLLFIVVGSSSIGMCCGE